MGFLTPFYNLYKIIRYHGGIWRTLQVAAHVDDVKIGHLVGEDEFGNRYYENNYYFFGRNRWVHYAPKFGYDYDASQISSEYFNWIHHITDVPPSYDYTRPQYHWKLPHTENPTGTRLEYVPYSTVMPKIQAWKPKPKEVPPPPPVYPWPKICPREPDEEEIKARAVKPTKCEEWTAKEAAKLEAKVAARKHGTCKDGPPECSPPMIVADSRGKATDGPGLEAKAEGRLLAEAATTTTTHRADKSDKSEKTDKADKCDKNEKADKAEKSDKNEKTDKTEKSDKKEKSDKNDKPEEKDKPCTKDGDKKDKSNSDCGKDGKCDKDKEKSK